MERAGGLRISSQGATIGPTGIESSRRVSTSSSRVSLPENGVAVMLPLRRLYLLRHAKSSWADPRLDDHDRPLAERGEDAVVRLRQHLASTGVEPDLVLCSSARRTLSTLEGIASALPANTTVLVEQGLYGATSSELLDRLHAVSDDVAGVLMIGHNPGLEVLAATLIGDGEDDLRRSLAAKFPTGALATLAFGGNWTALAPAAATLAAFTVPRQLLSRRSPATRPLTRFDGVGGVDDDVGPEVG